jgi:HEAT repeat protein
VAAGARFSGRAWIVRWSEAPPAPVVEAALGLLGPAALALALAPPPDAVERVATHDPEPGVRRAAWMALVASPRAPPELLAAALRTEHPDVTAAAAVRLAGLGPARTVDLEAVLLDTSPTIETLAALGRVGGARALPVLTELARGGAWSPLATAARDALAGIRARHATAVGGLAVVAGGGEVSLAHDAPAGRLSSS